MTFAVGVVAHTSRVSAAKELARTVRAEFISVDNGILGCDANHAAVLGHLGALGADWAVVLEDDAVPVADFRAQLGLALDVAPEPIVSLYLGRQRPPHWQGRIGLALAKADAVGAHWLTAGHLLHAVGYAIRSDLLPALNEFDSPFPSDQHVSAFARRHGHRVCYAVPSLVDHADWPTIVDHPDGQARLPGRRAWRSGVRSAWSPKHVVLR